MDSVKTKTHKRKQSSILESTVPTETQPKKNKKKKDKETGSLPPLPVKASTPPEKTEKKKSKKRKSEVNGVVATHQSKISEELPSQTSEKKKKKKSKKSDSSESTEKSGLNGHVVSETPEAKPKKKKSQPVNGVTNGHEETKSKKKKSKALNGEMNGHEMSSTSIPESKKSKKKKSKSESEVKPVLAEIPQEIKPKKQKNKIPNGETNGMATSESTQPTKTKKKKKSVNGETNGHTAPTIMNGHTNGDSHPETKKKEKGKAKLMNGHTNGINGHLNGESKKSKKSKKSLEKSDSSESLSPSMNGHMNGHTKPQKSVIETKDKSGKTTTLEVEISGHEGSLEPYLDFASAKFSGTWWTKLIEGFIKPTPIQSYCWPALITGRDVIGIAETGSGKTLAFSMPILSRLEKEGKSKSKSIKMLVMAPTRELAMQTYNVVKEGCSAICIYGGVKKHEQRNQLTAQKPVVVIGTPGRIVDFMDEGSLTLSEVEYFILDEADRMLDLGFEPAIRQVVAQLPPKRQTIMFSATWPTDIQAMANRYLTNPIKITIGASSDGEAKACARVQQIVEVIKEPFRRDNRLKELLKKYHSTRTNRVLIFVLYKKEAVRLEQTLSRSGWKVTSIHGDKSQADRTKALNSFKDGTSPLLLATDVASRGLDIPDVEYVINYSFPLTIEDYVHRIGRTGRAGKTGIAHTLFTDLDKAHAGELAQTLRTAGIEVPEALAAYGGTIKKKVHSNYGAHFKEVDPNVKAKKVVL